jgi:hypothetical protein
MTAIYYKTYLEEKFTDGTDTIQAQKTINHRQHPQQESNNRNNTT